MATDTNEQAEAGAAKKRLLPIALAAVAALLAGGLSGAFVAGPLLAERAAPPAAAETHAADPEEQDGGADGASEGGEAAARPIHTVENLVLNPAGTSGTRFLMVTVALELADDAAAAQAKQRDPEVRDVLLRVLGTKTVDALTDVGAREALKRELKDSTSAVFRKKGAVRGLYLPQFVVQ